MAKASIISVSKSRFVFLQHKITQILKKPESFFLVFSVFFGFIFVFITPPLQVPDEQAHFIRAYQVSNLDFVSQGFQVNGETRYGSDLPSSINKANGVFIGNVAGHAENEFPKSIYKAYIGQPLAQDKTQKTIVEAAAVYSPVVYIPQAIGITIGKLFDASPLVLIWVGRIMNLALWVTIMYLAIRLFPFAKWAIVILALNPVAVFISASLSPDVTNISLAFLFVSLVAYAITQKKTLSRRYLTLLIALPAILALSKPVNLVFCLLLLAVPWRQLGSKLRYIYFCAGGILLSAVLFLFWNYQIKDILEVAVAKQYAGNISGSGQLSYILGAPIEYLSTIVRNYIIVTPGTAGDAVLGTFFGVFGWLDTSIPMWTIFLYVLTLFFALLYQIGRGAALTSRQKLIFLSVFVLGFIGNVTAMYFNSTTIGNHVISGVQGRYFIAFSVLILGIFTARKKILILSDKAMTLIMSSSMLVILGMTAFKLLSRYY